MFGRIVFAALFVSAVTAVAWDDYNDPAAFGEVYNFTFNGVPQKAELKVIPWTDNYWPSNEGGLAYRWNARPHNNFQYKTLNETQVRAASAAILRTLSPAEKFDIYMNRFDYPLVRSEWLRTHPSDAGWEGLCHGWAPAAGFYTEPNPIKVKAPNGIEIEFGSADIKGLLTYYNAEYVHTNAYFLSQRCEYDLDNQPDMGDTAACWDMNPATLHLVLTNQIAMGKFFVADVDRGYAVWNQPVYKYSYSVTENRPASNLSAPGTVKEVRVSTVMTYARESIQQWEIHGDDPVTFSKYYDYWLELDANDKIVGGTWISDERSDFAWKNKLPGWTGYFKSLGRIYALAINLPDPGDNVTNTVHALARVNHRVYTNKAGSFAVSDYKANHQQSWVIAPTRTSSITLTFPAFSTKKGQDKLKIYEGADGQGPLLAVLHGERVPQTLRLQAKAVFVTFQADRQGSGAGFRVNYKAL